MNGKFYSAGQGTKWGIDAQYLSGQSMRGCGIYCPFYGQVSFWHEIVIVYLHKTIRS